MSEPLKKGNPIFREFLRGVFKLGPALKELGIELHMICEKCSEDVYIEEKLTAGKNSAISIPADPVSGEVKAVCGCTERGVWGK